MAVTSFRSRLSVLTLLPLILQQTCPVHSKPKRVTCSFRTGQSCTDTIKRHQLVEREGWTLLRESSSSSEYFARASCPGPCETTLPVWRDLQGSREPLFLSFYYNIWTTSGGVSSPPVLKIATCREHPNWTSNESATGNDSLGAPSWQGAVIRLTCSETFNISFVAAVSVDAHRIAVDNIALTYGFSTKGILPPPSYDVLTHLETTVPPVESTTKTTSNIMTGPQWNSSTTRLPYVTKAEGGGPHRTLAVINKRGMKMEDHVAFKPAVITLFISVVCATTIIVHVLICRNQRQISTRLRRFPAITVSNTTLSDKEPTSDSFTCSYSSNHGSQHRSVSFCSQNGVPLPGEEEDTKSSFQKVVRRRQSDVCIRKSTEPSRLRPNGRANTTPSKPKDGYYESIDSSNGSPGESTPIKILHKISLTRLPRFFESKKFPSSCTLEKKKNRGNGSSAEIPSLVSVAVDSNTDKREDRLKGGEFNPPLPPRTYSVGAKKYTAKSNSTSQLITNHTVSLRRVKNIHLTDNDRRWSAEVIPVSKVSPLLLKGQSSSKQSMDDSQQSLDTVVESGKSYGDDPPGESGHGYYVLEQIGRDDVEDKFAERERWEELERRRRSSKMDCPKYAVPQKKADRHRTGEDPSGTDSVGELKGESLNYESEFGGYHILEKQDSSCSSRGSSYAVEERGYEGDISSSSGSNAYYSLGGSASSQHTYQSLEQQIMAPMSWESDRDSVAASDQLGLSRSSSMGTADNRPPSELSADGSDGPIIINCQGHGGLLHKDDKADGVAETDMYVKLDPESEVNHYSSPENVEGGLSTSPPSDQCDYRKLVREGKNILNADVDCESSDSYDHIQRLDCSM